MAGRHRNEVMDSDIHPLYSAKYRAGPTTGKFDAMEIDRLFQWEVVETTAAVGATPIVFARKNTVSSS